MGLKDLAKPSPFHIMPKAPTEEEEMPEDEQRESRLPRYTTEDDPVLGRPKSRKRILMFSGLYHGRLSLIPLWAPGPFSDRKSVV